jgi:hypothetical protein
VVQSELSDEEGHISYQEAPRRFLGGKVLIIEEN